MTEDHRITSRYPAMSDLERAARGIDEPTIPPHLQARIDKIKARATEMGMDPSRFDDLITETTDRVHNALNGPSEPLRATNPPHPVSTLTKGVVIVCAAFVTGAAVGRWLSR